MNSALWIVAAKEVLENFRDRRTIARWMTTPRC